MLGIYLFVVNFKLRKFSKKTILNRNMINTNPITGVSGNPIMMSNILSDNDMNSDRGMRISM
jgi:hypothetical protein